MAATSEEISEGFLEFDIEINDEQVMIKLEEIAAVFSLDADELVNEWLAYQSRNHQQPLSYDELEHLEREISSFRAKSHVKKFEQSPLTSVSLSAPQEAAESMDIIEGYCSPGNRGKLRNMQISTPIKPDHKRVKAEFSPSVFSPMSASKSEKYAGRSNSGEIVAELGDCKNIDPTFWHNGRSSSTVITCKAPSIKEIYKYMFQKVTNVCVILNDGIESFSDDMQQQHSSSIESYAPCCAPSQGEINIVCKIKNETQSRLTPHSVVLDGDRVHSFGRSVAVELDQLSEYSLFPGQNVAMRGVNPTGKKFIASHIYCPVTTKGTISVGNVEDFSGDSEKVHMMIAAGPFTTSDSLSYEPLEDFITAVKRSCPDVAILIGPLLDANHKEVENGMVTPSFVEFASNWITYIRNSLESFTQLVFIPSLRDVFHHPVFPQPPYPQKKSEKSFFMANPSTFDVGGITIGATAADILFHLGAEEISKCSPSSSTDRLARLAGHLFAQNSFYPLYPTHESISLDVSAAEFGCKLPEDIDILLLPSDLKCFIKCLDGRLCINPGRLAKGLGGGTYARIAINGLNDKKAVVQIVKI